ncbi:MAG: exopolyphosphatase, partial [Polyangiales bacterium]
RLIYLGVERSLEEPLQRRLVVDIGGGSTECIVGDGAQILAADSLFMGCVSYSERYFRDGGLSEAAMRAATTAAALELQSLASRYERLGFDDAVGSSGTITVIEDILRAQGLSSSGVTARGLKKLRKQVQSAGHVSRLQLPGMPNERAPVLPGGIAILSALFEVFALERMQVATAALREGLVHDLAGPEGGQAVRERSIAQLAERHGVDQEQAEAVAETALGLLTQVPDEWLSGVPDAAPWLRWAALVHEVGQSLRYSGYHRHGEYILRHSDLAGFSRQTQRALALMVRSHRRKLDVERFADGVLETQRKGLLRLCLLLRLAVRLCRNRGPALAQAPELTVKKKQLALTFAPGWLADHPLTEAGLEEEATQIAAVGYTLTAR